MLFLKVITIFFQTIKCTLFLHFVPKCRLVGEKFHGVTGVKLRAWACSLENTVIL